MVNLVVTEFGEHQDSTLYLLVVHQFHSCQNVWILQGNWRLITFLYVTYLCWTLCGNRSVLTHSQQPLLFLPSNDNPGQTVQRQKELVLFLVPLKIRPQAGLDQARSENMRKTGLSKNQREGSLLLSFCFSLCETKKKICSLLNCNLDKKYNLYCF